MTDNGRISETLRREAELGPGAGGISSMGREQAHVAGDPENQTGQSGPVEHAQRSESSGPDAKQADDASGTVPGAPAEPDESAASERPARRFKPEHSAVLPEAGPEADEQSQPARKRLFIGLICGTSLLLCLILVLGWGVPYIGFENIHPSVPYITGTLLVLVILFIGWAALSLVLQVITGKVLFGTRLSRGVTVKLLLPLMEFSGRVIGIAPKNVRRSFIQVNNELVESAARQHSPDKLLILLPHCIQWNGCNLRVSNRLERFKRVGTAGVGSQP